jgi:hypothetical protein
MNLTMKRNRNSPEYPEFILEWEKLKNSGNLESEITLLSLMGLEL